MWLTTGEFIGCMFTLIITESKLEYFNDTVDISNIILGLSNMLPLCMFECGCGLWAYFRTVEHGRNLADDSELGILERSQCFTALRQCGSWKLPGHHQLLVLFCGMVMMWMIQSGFSSPGSIGSSVKSAAHHGFRGQNLQPNDWHGEIPMLGGRPVTLSSWAASAAYENASAKRTWHSSSLRNGKRDNKHHSKPIPRPHTTTS